MTQAQGRLADTGVQPEATGSRRCGVHSGDANRSETGTCMTLAFALERVEQWPLARLQPLLGDDCF